MAQKKKARRKAAKKTLGRKALKKARGGVFPDDPDGVAPRPTTTTKFGSGG